MKVQVNVTSKVNSKAIRREQHNGREHWVVPSYTLPANVVMNGGLYPASEIDQHYTGLEGTLAPLGHPQVNGQFVSAFSPEGLNVGYVGAWNKNVKKSGNRVYVEKWIDTEVAKRTDDGKRLLERLEALEKGDDVPPIHTSVAVFLEELEQIGSMVSEAVATNTEKAIKPLAEKVDALQANQQQLSEALTANSRAEEKTKREAVAKVHGEIVANALSGEALDAMYKTIGDAAPLGTNSAQHQKETGAPAASEYFK
ncbi:hypothetical protein BUM41_18840 [Salmonella enterica subsp. enterica serovar Schwarzengrund]|nr:hypothetical protein [Salmonella enterica subsp. enterica serovar Schwarzengrund]